MYRVDILISNDRHHVEMALPVARRMLDRRKYSPRVLSLCEFRGMETPERLFGDLNIPVVRLSKVLRPFAVKKKIRAVKSDGIPSRVAREFAWRFILKRNLEIALRSPPDVIVLFNDAAYPYDRITRLLRNRGIRFLLIQEGIRFDATEAGMEGAVNQGRGGADAIAVFGESSAQFFIKQGAPVESVHLTGNPRFDQIAAWQSQASERIALEKLKLGTQNLLFLSNPIEFHGYCTKVRKLELVRDFIAGIDPLFEKDGFRLVFKLHGNESAEDFLRISQGSKRPSQIAIAEAGLYPLLQTVDAAVIFGTTAGLEALLFGVPLGVIEIPEVGFLHDYVQEGGGIPLRWSMPMSDQVEDLIRLKGQLPLTVNRYLARTLASIDDSTSRVLDVVESLLPNRGGLAESGRVALIP